MKRMMLSFLLLTASEGAAFGWELLTLRDGTVAEGDIVQEQFVLREESGSEVLIPRAAILELSNAGSDGELFEVGVVEARIKDGTSVRGVLKDPVEIQDGMVSRRYDPADVSSIRFDQFVDLDKRKEFTTCPIRFELDASYTLFESTAPVQNFKTSRVKCNALNIRAVTFDRKGKLRPGKALSVAAEFQVWVPEGHDQWADLSLQVVQNGKVLARKSLRTGLDEGELSRLSLLVDIPAGRLDPAGPPPTFRVQLVNQDSKEVEKGTFFWWFTIPLPI